MKNPLLEYGLFGWNYWYLITHPWVLFVESYYYTKWFIQRGWRGYADCDAWNLSSHLTSYMGNALRALADSSRGTPLIESGRALDPNDLGDCDSLTIEEWKATINYIAETFDVARKLEDMEYRTIGEYEQAQKRVHQGLEMFNEYFFSLWD